MLSLRLSASLAILSLLGALAACGDPAPPPPDPTIAAGELAAVEREQAAQRAAAERVAHEHAHDAPTATPAIASPPRMPVVARTVEYGQEGDTVLSGYLAVPEAQADTPPPGIIVIHEWWGLNDNIRKMTERLAGEGYAALAVDLYMGGTSEDPQGAAELMQTLMNSPERGWRNLRAAHTYLVESFDVPAVASLGWCLGGRWALEAARAMPQDIDAVVIYYGNVPADAEVLQPLNMPILGLFAADDMAVPLEGVHAFRDQLAALGKNAHIEIYPGVDHAFANPSGGNYEPVAAEDAWQRTLAFLAAHLADMDTDTQ
jgi:carboxymethylenebutenolidase